MMKGEHWHSFCLRAHLLFTGLGVAVLLLDFSCNYGEVRQRRALEDVAVVAPPVTADPLTIELEKHLVADSWQNIIWLDTEFTRSHYEVAEDGVNGIWDADPHILEVAVIVTDKDLTELGRGSWVIGGFEKAYLEQLGDFHQRSFRDQENGGEFPPWPDSPGNGLFSEILSSNTTLEAAENSILKLLMQHCPARRCPIAGNSIQCDLTPYTL